MSGRCVGCQVGQGRECACREAQQAADEVGYTAALLIVSVLAGALLGVLFAWALL